MAKDNKYDKYSKEELIDELEALKKKKYGLVWDKNNSQEMLDTFVNWENVPENFTPKQFPILKEIKDREIETNKKKPVNLLIEGDNYHSLAVLNFTHQNKVDVIYIDPPYNTGNKDFIYNDKFVDKDDPWRHSKWLSFMEKRLKLAKPLLKDSGAIFISIDDHEVAQLKLLCDEIFGEKNFVECISWEKKSSAKGVPPKNMIVNVHEYILIYQKSEKFSFMGEPRSEEGFSNPDNDPRGLWRNTNIKSTIKSRSQAFSITDPETGNVFTDTWAYSKNELDRLVSEKYLIFPKDKNGQVRKKEFYNEFKNANIPIKSAWGLFDNQKNTEMLKNFLGSIIFLNPKPLDLIMYLIKGSADRNAIVLDFFAGSGTTAHAVLVTNNKDKGERKFILCTNNENGIMDDVCYPRIKRVVDGHKDYPLVTKISTNLKYFKTDFVGSDSTDKNKRDLVNKSSEMICIKEDIFELLVDEGLDFKIYQKDNKFLGIIFDVDAIDDFKKESEKHKGSFIVYCFSYTDAIPENDFRGLNNKYILKPIPAMILKVYEEIFNKKVAK